MHIQAFVFPTILYALFAWMWEPRGQMGPSPPLLRREGDKRRDVAKGAGGHQQQKNVIINPTACCTISKIAKVPELLGSFIA